MKSAGDAAMPVVEVCFSLYACV
uniref:Uncharacterized protein n=1 Tax=Rhizophora mucronata TaxID=61149 RepID=A0A2P2N6P5_RHIMU